MGGYLESAVHFILTWVPAWLGFSGWCFSMIMILEGKRGMPKGSGSLHLERGRVPFYLAVALVLGAALAVVFKLGAGVGRGVLIQ